MKVLLSAIACDPFLGSENFVGWTAALTLAREHELWIITSERNRESLGKAAAGGMVPPNIHFVHAGRFREWHPNKMRARFQDWNEYR